MKNILPAPVEIDEASLGPAMLALTSKQRQFVLAKVFLGLNDMQAARFAGYADVNAHAYHVAHREDVQAAILEEGRKLMRTQGPASIHTLVAIRDDAEQAGRDRLKAAVELLNRAGFHAISEHHEHSHQHLTEGQMDKRILALAAELGMAPEEAKKMLIAPAEFKKNSQGVFVDESHKEEEITTEANIAGDVPNIASDVRFDPTTGIEDLLI